MIVRRCSQGHRVRIHKNTTPGATRTKTYSDGSTETLTYPSSYDYFVDIDGSVSKKTNSFKTAEEFYVAECAKKHGDGHGRLIVGGHHVINGVATLQSDYPTDSNTKSEIKDFYDKRGVVYGGSETKSELLSRITNMVYRGEIEVSKHLKV
jgi:hypothetical protein|tara:strand:+ start:133 stop:585 length:453 start_codon:yes stop_codon:yes gene_type:complete